MPRGRSDMRRVKEVLRLAHELGYSSRQIQDSVRLGRTTVGEYLARARAAGVRYADVAEMSEAAVEAMLFKCPEPAVVRPLPDWRAVAADMRRRGVTLQLLWQEYRGRRPDGYSYSQFRVITAPTSGCRANRGCGGRRRRRRCARSTTPARRWRWRRRAANARPACSSARCRSRPPSTPRRPGRKAPRTGWAAMLTASFVRS